jgi:hypothetical protein
VADLPRARKVERVRPLKATRITTCPDCATEVGVSPEYNHSINRTGVKPGVWRVAIHPRGRVSGEPRCPGSRMLIDELVVVDKRHTT